MSEIGRQSNLKEEESVENNETEESKQHSGIKGEWGELNVGRDSEMRQYEGWRMKTVNILHRMIMKVEEPIT